MADPNQDQDDLVSQDDIDKLLDSASIEAPEENPEVMDADQTDDLGELSQDDIERLMGRQTTEPAPDDPEAEGELSQNDIDSLLNSGADNTPADEQENTQDDPGELSQDDIDSLLGGGSVSLEEDGRNDDDPEEDGDEYEEMELIDQADIDRLMNPSQNPETPQETAASPETAADSEFMETDETVNQATRDDFVISPDQAVNAADCRITQETLDVLMQNPPEIVPAQDPVVLDEPQAARETQVPAPDQVNLDDVDLDAPEEEVLETLPDQGDVTQEDIDALLRDPYEEDEEEAEMTAASDDGTAPDGEAASDEEDEEDILISQDDIDTLLMSADQEDEDILGNALGNDLEDILDNDAADQDFSDNEDDPDTPDNDQVILEKAGSEDAWIDEGRPQRTGDKWYRSKLLAAVASALLVLAIAVPAAYFLFFPRVPELPITNEQTIQAIGEITRDGQAAEGLLENLQDVPSEVDSVIVDVAPLVPVAKSGSMVLKNFIVLASDQSTDMAYITLDISVDYSDQRAYDEINSNLPFFRDLIYASIQQNLVWEKRNEVTQNELIMGVEAGLKNVLPKGYIDKVSFTSFETS